DHLRDHQAGDRAVGEALARVAADHVNVIDLGELADVREAISGLDDLSRPSRDDVADERKPLARPALELVPAFVRISTMTDAMIAAADEQYLVTGRARGEPHVVIGVRGVPHERVRES